MLGGLLSLAGLVALWRSWLRPRRFWPGLALGWGLICAALPLWGIQFGADRGAAMGLFAVSTLGLLVVGLTSRRDGPLEAPSTGGALPHVTWRWLTVLLLAGPGGFALSTGAELLFVAHGPGTEVDRIVFGILFLVPLVWALVLIAASADWRRRFVAAMLHSHSVVGLAFSAVLYWVCLSGAVAVLADDIDRWDQSDLPSYERMAPEAVERASRAAYDLAKAPPRLFLVLPTPTTPHTVVLAGEDKWRADSDGALLGPAPEGWGEFVTDLHVRLHVPGIWGYSLVGLTGIGMTALIISGLLAHPRIFRDAFRWRRGGNLRVSQADLHNRIGVWGSPLFLALALTGAFLGLAQLVIIVNAQALHGGDRAAAMQLLYGDTGPASGDPAPLVDLTGPLRQLEAMHPDYRPLYAEISAPGTTGQRVHLYAVPPDRLAYGERFDFDADAQFAGVLGMASGEIGRQVFASVYPVHFGTFGGLPVRLLYFLFGIGLSVVCAGGVDIWLTRTRISGWPARVWPGVAWGSPALLALTAATIASPALFWGGQALILGVLAMKKGWSPAKIRAVLQGATAVLLIALPVIHAIRHGVAPSLVDVGLLAIASSILSGLRVLFQSREIVTE